MATLLLCLMLAAKAPAPVDRYPKAPMPPPPAVDDLVRRVVCDEAFVPLERPFDVGRSQSQAEATYTYDLAFPSVDGWPGAADTGGAGASVRADGTHVAVHSLMRVRLASQPPKEDAAIAEAAKAYVLRVWPHVFDGAECHLVVDPRLEPLAACRRVMMEARVRELTMFRVVVSVNAWTLRVAGVEFDCYAQWAAAYGAGMFPPRQAAAVVKAALPRPRPVQVIADTVQPCPIRTMGRQVYTVVLHAMAIPSRAPCEATGQVDALTGRLMGEVHVGGPQEMVDGGAQWAVPGVANSRMPRWTKEGLVFVSDLSISGLPWTSRLNDQLYLRRADGTITALTCDAGAGVRWVGASSGGPWVALGRFWRWNAVQTALAIDLATGRVAMAGFGEYWPQGKPVMPGPPRMLADQPPPNWCLFMPTIGTDGRWAVGSDGVDDGALLSASLDGTWPALGERGKVRSKSRFACPTVSQDGQWLYFAEADETGWRVCRAPYAAVCRVGTVDRPALPATTVARAPQPVTDISEAGGQLVVSMAPEPLRRDRSAWTHVRMAADGTNARPLVLTGRGDPDLGTPISGVQDAVAGPGANEVTFSGVVAAAPAPARRLYQLDLAADRLTALTPALDQSVPAHRFGERLTAVEAGLTLIAGEYAHADRSQRRLPVAGR